MTLAAIVPQEDFWDELLKSLGSWQPVRCKEGFSEETGEWQPLDLLHHLSSATSKSNHDKSDVWKTEVFIVESNL
jgi:hypothetical protein